MTSRTLLLALGTTLALSACQTNQDPSQGGFLSGISNLNNGTYERRVQERQEALENEQDINLQRNRSVERLNAQSADVRASRNAAEADYLQMNRDLSSMRSRLAKAQAANASKKAEADALQKQIDALAAKAKMVQQDTFTPEADKQARLDALRAERQALEREVDLLVGR
jgi:chromosome segregation ATPase